MSGALLNIPKTKAEKVFPEWSHNSVGHIIWLGLVLFCFFFQCFCSFTEFISLQQYSLHVFKVSTILHFVN